MRVMDHVLEIVLQLDPIEVFCEVLNPKGDNLQMMRKALVNEFPHYAIAIANYSTEKWANFTWEVLDYGHKRSPVFIPWPDSKRSWQKYISIAQTTFLNEFLPPA
jgi:hypothetical protein